MRQHKYLPDPFDFVSGSLAVPSEMRGESRMAVKNVKMAKFHDLIAPREFYLNRTLFFLVGIIWMNNDGNSAVPQQAKVVSKEMPTGELIVIRSVTLGSGSMFSCRHQSCVKRTIKVVVRACYEAYFVAHVFKYLPPKFVSGRPA